MEFKVHKKENLYFAIKVIFTAIIALAVLAFIGSNPIAGGTAVTVFVLYAAMIALAIFFQKIFLVAYMKGDGVLVSERQFPEVYRRYAAMAEKLGLRNPPPLFVLQQGGALNAFAIRFSRRNYIAVYADLFALCDRDPDAVDFVLAHELGHVRRAHMSKAFWTLPSALVPFLESAWSRACEYTCDNIGGALTGPDKTAGLILLAGGSDLYRRIDIPNYLESAREHRTRAVRFAGLFMSHPWIPARIENLKDLNR